MGNNGAMCFLLYSTSKFFMRIEYCSERYRQDFLNYAHMHAEEHDSSYVPHADFISNNNDPTYLLIETDRVIAAASLMFEGFEKIGKARFRILHTIQPNEEQYRLLLTHLLPHAQHVSSCFAFIPEHLTLTRQIWETLGFTIERYAFVLKRSLNEIPQHNWPHGYHLRPMKSGEEAIYADVLNRAFKDELGRYAKTADDIKAMQGQSDYIPGSLQLFFKKDDEPVGILATSIEESNTERNFWIDTIGLLPDYQGLRLGRQLLRAGCRQALLHNVHNIMLSVQAQNEKAADLYLSEGFEKLDTMICYEIDPTTYSK